MKRVVLLFVTTVFMLAAMSALPAFAQPTAPISVTVDGLAVAFDVHPAIRDGRTLVPFRAIAEDLNVNVNWDSTVQTVHATDGSNTLRLQIGSTTAYLNGTETALDVPPLIIDGRTLIPLRVFSEAFGCEVVWNANARLVTITSPPQPMTVVGYYALGDSRTSSWTNLFGRPYPETAPGRTDVVGELALGWYSLDTQGNLLTESTTGWQRPAGWENVLQAAAQYGLGTEMVVHMTNRDRALESMLRSRTAVEQAVAQIKREAALYDGVNLDLEGLGLSAAGAELTRIRQDFTAFVSLLAAELRPAGKRLTLTLHAPNSAYKGYDYRALGASADRIVIMAYDYGPKPEPDHLVRSAVEAAASAVPAHKLILGISAPSETPASLVAKVGIAKRYKLDGIALWRLGLISDDMWDGLRRSVRRPGR